MFGDRTETRLEKFHRSLNDIMLRVNGVFSKERDTIGQFVEEVLSKNDVGDDLANQFKKVLEYVCFPVTDCPTLRDQVVWFNVWVRSHGKVFFLINHTGNEKKIIQSYDKPNWENYTISLSQLAKQSGKSDRSFIIVDGKDKQKAELISQDARLEDLFIVLDFEQVDNLINGKTETDSSEDISDYVCEHQKKNYEIIKEKNELIENLKEQICEVWGSVDLKDDTIVKLANYYGWVRLAYGKQWGCLLYFPGIIAKGYEQIPFGVNIGFKAIPDIEAILFIKQAVLMFFTRLSVDWYEKEREIEIFKRNVKIAEAAIMSRNLSHNIGSHVLSSSKLIPSVGVLINDSPQDKEENHSAGNKLEAYKAGASLKLFNSYLQGRLDFIARSLSDGRDLPEPLYFLNDLLSPFWMQSVLLQNLLADLEYTADKIVFHVRIDGGEFVEYSWNQTEKIFLQESGDRLRDVLVGVPGGDTGAQAFYGFLENVMRNAAKYGGKKDEFHLYLSLHKCRYGEHDHGPRERKAAGNAWILSIWDNLSDGGQCYGKIRKLIETPLIDDQGRPNSNGHGIQEMRLCADYLAGDHTFPPDEGGYTPENYCSPCSYESDGRKGCQPTCNYCGGISDAGSTIESRYPLRCYPLKEGERTALCYNLIIPAATILGVIGLEKPESGPEHESVSFYTSIKELALQNPQFAIIVDSGGQSIDEKAYLEEISRYHTALPFRLMVLVPNDTQREEAWNLAIEDFPKPSDRKDEYLTLGGWIPDNRVRVVANSDLISALKNPDNAKFLGCEGWEAVMLRVYDAWLCAYKGEELKETNSGKWRLLIGFDHGGEQILPRWKEKACKMFRADEDSSESVIALDVFASDSQSSSTLEESIKNEAVVAYDNHGKTLTLVGMSKAKCASYHEFGLNKGLTLYQSLSSPPQSRFGVGYFVYSLVESALTRVFVLDERFAGAMAMEDEANILDEPIHSVVKSCRMNPVFAIRKDKDDVEPDNISPIVDGPFSFDMDRYKLVNAESKPQPVDVFVIHEGVLDKQTSESAKVKWNRERDTWRLFQVAPMVVRCSGRGAETRQLDDRISFVEFNHVSKNTYIEINKLGLVKSLLGSGGHMKKKGGHNNG